MAALEAGDFELLARSVEDRIAEPSREPLLPGGRVNPGTGGVVAIDETVAVRDVVRTLLDFNTRESCGKCTPCREGTSRLRDMLA